MTNCGGRETITYKHTEYHWIHVELSDRECDALGIWVGVHEKDYVDNVADLAQFRISRQFYQVGLVCSIDYRNNIYIAWVEIQIVLVRVGCRSTPQTLVSAASISLAECRSWDTSSKLYFSCENRSNIAHVSKRTLEVELFLHSMIRSNYKPSRYGEKINFPTHIPRDKKLVESWNKNKTYILRLLTV
jgi:hypothetical protein